MFARIAFVVVIAFSIGMAGALVLREFPTQSVIQTGKALIGGPFTLTNHKGETVTERDFTGRHMLVVFGYTYCPDICPAELQLMTDALNKAGPSAESVTPVFITIDPQRDTIEQIAAYISNFHPRMVGLTGTDEQIRQAAEAYRVFYSRAESSRPDDDLYLMDHSTFIYLMDPQGEYLRHFPYGTSSEELAASITQAVSGAS